MRPAIWKWSLSNLFIFCCNKFYCDGKLAGRKKIEFYSALHIIAEGKSLIIGEGDAGDLGVALGAHQNVVPTYVDSRRGPEAKITYKKLA